MNSILIEMLYLLVGGNRDYYLMAEALKQTLIKFLRQWRWG